MLILIKLNSYSDERSDISLHYSYSILPRMATLQLVVQSIPHLNTNLSSPMLLDAHLN